MNFQLILSVWILYLTADYILLTVSWNFCYNGKEKEICGEQRHVVCVKNTTEMEGTFLSEGPMTYFLIKTFLKKINSVRNEIAGGNYIIEGNQTFPTAAKMRELTWDNELEFFALSRSNTCTTVHSNCTASPKYKQAGEIIGMYGSETKPIRIAPALDGIFEEIIDQGKRLTDLSQLSKPYTETWGKKARDFLVLVNDRASRVGCGFVLATDCGKSEKERHPYCYFFTCVLDVVNVEGCPVYEISTAGGAAGKACKEAFGKEPGDTYPNLCANNGWLYKKQKCTGFKEFRWCEWARGDEPSKFVLGVPPNLNELPVSMPIAKQPDAEQSVRGEVIEPLNKDDPDQLCGLLRHKPESKTTLAFCADVAKKKSDLKHVACNAEKNDKLIGLYWPGKFERALLLELNNRMRDNVAVGKEFSIKTGKVLYFPAATRMRELMWDCELEWLAMSEAKDCSPENSRCRGTKDFKFIGHIMYEVPYKSSLNLGLAHVIFKAFSSVYYDEKNKIENPESQADNVETKAFHQLIVDKASRLGCGISKCKIPQGDYGGHYFLVCFYDTRNAAFNDDNYQTGECASECKSAWNLGISKQYPHLCAASKDRSKIKYQNETEDEFYAWKLKKKCAKFGFTDCSVIKSWPKKSNAGELDLHKSLTMIIIFYNIFTFLHFYSSSFY